MQTLNELFVIIQNLKWKEKIIFGINKFVYFVVPLKSPHRFASFGFCIFSVCGKLSRLLLFTLFDRRF